MVREFVKIPPRLFMFLAGIILAVAVLGAIGFRSVKNEEWIAETNYENSRNNLKNAIFGAIKNENLKFVREIRRFAQNENFAEESVPGLKAISIFKNEELTYPKAKFNTDSIGDFGREIYSLPLSEARKLSEFRNLYNSKKFSAAYNYAINSADEFLTDKSIINIDWQNYFLTSMLNDILSQENLSHDNRERAWKKLKEISRLITDLKNFLEHEKFLLSAGNYALFSGDGISFAKDFGENFIVISPPELPANNAIIAGIDSAVYASRLLKAVADTAREWSTIEFSILETASDLLYEKSSFVLIPDFPHWSLILEDNSDKIKRASQNKTMLLYVMVFFSLIIPIVGVVMVYRGVVRERQLVLMKDNFLSTISHELKTPLTSVKMYAELMNSGRVQKPEKIVSYTSVILKETARLEGLIEAILNYTRMENGKNGFHWENINLAECVQKVCDSLTVIAEGKGLKITAEIEENCFIIGDYSSIYSLVQNLVDNAIKYTAAGTISVQLTAEEKTISLSVTDTGKGIPANEQKNIFEGFYRIGDESTRETKGSGLGLAIVRRTADAHKAAIILKSAIGRGSTFTVIFKKSEGETQHCNFLHSPLWL
ncbi:hypothetical protein AGMMS49938_17500 [Fibrobacterales bacterium]|nr:hypothetical protein AGMMS49938_17500 [Fibrobacterales bacterium]